MTGQTIWQRIACRGRRAIGRPLALLAVALTLASTSALVHAQPTWLTVMGDPANAAEEIVQVDPIPIGTPGAERVMRLRINRTHPRTSWEGQTYRSVDAVVTFRCGEQRAFSRALSYYKDPLWRGEPFMRVTYSDEAMRPLLFRDMMPNPLERLMKAACP